MGSKKPVSQKRTEDLENPAGIIDDIVDSIDQLHKGAATAATALGEHKEKLKALRPAWEQLADTPTSDPDSIDIFVTGVHALAAYRDELFGLRDRSLPMLGQLSSVAATSDSTSAITSASVVSISLGYPIRLIETGTLPESSRFAGLVDKLDRIDADLAATCRAIRENLYGTIAEPERSAMYLTRQAYDHLFSILAPDAQVRASRFFSTKERGNPRAITRDERLAFAAHTHVKDEAHRRTLLASSRHMTSVYKRLNKAHKRGRLDEVAARAALREMLSLIEQWVESLPQSKSA